MIAGFGAAFSAGAAASVTFATLVVGDEERQTGAGAAQGRIRDQEQLAGRGRHGLLGDQADLGRVVATVDLDRLDRG